MTTTQYAISENLIHARSRNNQKLNQSRTSALKLSPKDDRPWGLRGLSPTSYLGVLNDKPSKMQTSLSNKFLSTMQRSPNDQLNALTCRECNISQMSNNSNLSNPFRSNGHLINTKNRNKNLDMEEIDDDKTLSAKNIKDNDAAAVYRSQMSGQKSF